MKKVVSLLALLVSTFSFADGAAPTATPAPTTAPAAGFVCADGGRTMDSAYQEFRLTETGGTFDVVYKAFAPRTRTSTEKKLATGFKCSFAANDGRVADCFKPSESSSTPTEFLTAKRVEVTALDGMSTEGDTIKERFLDVELHSSLLGDMPTTYHFSLSKCKAL